MKNDQWRYVRAVELAQILGVSPGRVTQLKQAGLPQTEDRRYDLTVAIPWCIERAMEKADVTGAGSARSTYWEAMTEKAELESARLRGELYGKHETDQWLMGLVVEFRNAVRDIPERVTRDKQLANEIATKLDEALTAMADAVAGWCERGGTTAPSTLAAAKAARREVGRGKTPAS